MEFLHLYIQQESSMPLGGHLFLQDSVLPYDCYRNCTVYQISMPVTRALVATMYRRRSLHFRLYYYYYYWIQWRKLMMQILLLPSI
jgi:hypothetical protein